jgi:hypothetical protein
LPALQKSVENSRRREDEARATSKNELKRERDALEKHYERARQIDEQQIEQALKNGRIPERRDLERVLPAKEAQPPQPARKAPPFIEAAQEASATRPPQTQEQTPGRGGDGRRAQDRATPAPQRAEGRPRTPAPGETGPDREPQRQPAREETRADVSQQKSAPNFLDDDKMAEGWKQEIHTYGENLTRQQERGPGRGGDLSC